MKIRTVGQHRINRPSAAAMSLSEYVQKEDLVQLFHLSMKDAARRLNVSESSLRNICRKHNISRWPYRKFQQLEAHLSALRSDLEHYEREQQLQEQSYGHQHTMHEFRNGASNGQAVDSNGISSHVAQSLERAKVLARAEDISKTREMIESLNTARVVLQENPNISLEMAIIEANKKNMRAQWHSASPPRQEPTESSASESSSSPYSLSSPSSPLLYGHCPSLTRDSPNSFRKFSWHTKKTVNSSNSSSSSRCRSGSGSQGNKGSKLAHTAQANYRQQPIGNDTIIHKEPLQLLRQQQQQQQMPHYLQQTQLPAPSSGSPPAFGFYTAVQVSGLPSSPIPTSSFSRQGQQFSRSNDTYTSASLRAHYVPGMGRYQQHGRHYQPYIPPQPFSPYLTTTATSLQGALINPSVALALDNRLSLSSIPPGRSALSPSLSQGVNVESEEDRRGSESSSFRISGSGDIDKASLSPSLGKKESDLLQLHHQNSPRAELMIASSSQQPWSMPGPSMSESLLPSIVTGFDGVIELPSLSRLVPLDNQHELATKYRGTINANALP